MTVGPWSSWRPRWPRSAGSARPARPSVGPAGAGPRLRVAIGGSVAMAITMVIGELTGATLG